jgi:phage regulator Rha-like protein
MDMEIENQKINISTIKGKLTVSSMMVAEHFGKDHKNVLREIRRVMTPSETGGLIVNRSKRSFKSA